MEKKAPKLEFKTSLAAIIFYAAFSTLLLHQALLSPGIISGSDWGTWYTPAQSERYFDSYYYTWTDTGLFSHRTIFSTTLPYATIQLAFSKLGIGGEIFTKLFALFLLSFAGFAMFRLCRFFNLNVYASILAGAIYVTTPLFFNYLIMGWTFVLLAMGLMPLAMVFFMKAAEENNARHAVAAGLIYALGAIQPQAVIWFPIAFAALSVYLVNNKETLVRYAKTFAITLLVFALASLYWILPLALSPNPDVSGASTLTSLPSLGTALKFQPENIFRLWGSLYNFQFEQSVISSGLEGFSLLLPMLAILGAIRLYSRNKRLLLTLSAFAALPILFYFVNFNRNGLIGLPFVNVVRDFARFTIFSTMAYIVFAAVFLSALIDSKKRIQQALLAIILMAWFAAIFPWWNGDLTNWHSDNLPVTALRTKTYPPDYLEFETRLLSQRLDQKALYLPIGGAVEFEDDSKFFGRFKQAGDIFAGLSPIPGAIEINDRNLGPYAFASLLSTDRSAYLLELLSLTNTRLFVIRKNLHGHEAVPAEYFENKTRPFFFSSNIAAYSTKNFVPRVYVPKAAIIYSGSIGSLPELVSSGQYEPGSAIFFESDLGALTEGGLPNSFNNQALIFSKPSETQLKLPNPSFEEGLWEAKVQDCTAPMQGSPALDMQLSPDASHGNYSLQLGSKNHHACTSLKAQVNVTAGKRYALSFDYKNVRGKAVQYYYALLGNEGPESRTDFFYANNSGWNRFETTFRSAHDFSWIEVYFYAPSSGDFEVVNRFDNLKFAQLDATADTIINSARSQNPALEFKKVDPAKYRVRIHNASSAFPLVFLESFHAGWNAYAVRPSSDLTDYSIPTNYNVLDGNEQDQASQSDLSSFIRNGWASAPQTGKEPSCKNCSAGFISKNFQGTIQNNNLPNEQFYETWFASPVATRNHLSVNGFANAWLIDPLEICAETGTCIKNPDGSYDMEIVIEFWPQALFYVGLFGSALALAAFLLFLWPLAGTGASEVRAKRSG